MEIPGYAETRRPDIGQRVLSAHADGYAADASVLRRNMVTPIYPTRFITVRRHSRSDGSVVSKAACREEVAKGIQLRIPDDVRMIQATALRSGDKQAESQDIVRRSQRSGGEQFLLTLGQELA